MIQEITPNGLHIEYKEETPRPGDSLLYFHNDKVLARVENEHLEYPKYEREYSKDSFQYLFSVDARNYFLCVGEAERQIDGFSYEEAALFRKRINPKAERFAGLTAFHLYKWYRDHKYCGNCGTPREHDHKERMLRCPNCGNTVYPTISPAVIVGVSDGDRLLMTKYRGRERGDYALIAGFVEIGEMPEDTVRREVMEETGVRVKNLRYYRSQPWGYSNSLLLGFYAELDGEDKITRQEDELGVAEWVRREEIPNRFDGFSLTNEMICRFKDGKDKERYI